MAEIELERVQEAQVEDAPGRGRGFWRGVFVGTFLALLIATAGLYFLLNVRGVTFFLDQGRLATAVRDKVQARAAQAIPVMLAKIAADAAAVMAGSEGAPLLAMEIGGRRLELPAETAAFLQEEINDTAKTTIAASLNRFDAAPYANELADEACRMVEEILAEEVYDRTFQCRAFRWLTLPVTVQGEGP